MWYRQPVVTCDCKHIHVQTRTRRGHSSSPAVLRPVCWWYSHQEPTSMLMIFSPRNPRMEPDELLEAMNSCHSNIKFTVEENPVPFSRHWTAFYRKLIFYLGVQETWKTARTLVVTSSKKLEEKRNFSITTSSETHRFKLGIGSQKNQGRFPKLVTRCGLLTKLLMNLIVQLRIKIPFSWPNGSTTANPSHLKLRTASAMKMRQRS